MFHKTCGLIVVVVLLLSAHAAPAVELFLPVPLSDLFADPNNFVNVSDKQFGNFVLTNNSGSGIAADPAGLDFTRITVTGVINGGPGGDEIGLRFTDDVNNPTMILPCGLCPPPGLPTDSGIGASFFFDVQSFGPPIIDNTLLFGGVITGPSIDVNRITVEESVLDGPNGNQLAFKEVFLDTFGAQFEDHREFGPHQTLTIEKDIGLMVGQNPIDLAQIFFFEQSFSQQNPGAPEPSALVLAGLALFGLLCRITRRRR